MVSVASSKARSGAQTGLTRHKEPKEKPEILAKHKQRINNRPESAKQKSTDKGRQGAHRVPKTTTIEQQTQWNEPESIDCNDHSVPQLADVANLEIDAGSAPKQEAEKNVLDLILQSQDSSQPKTNQQFQVNKIQGSYICENGNKENSDIMPD